MRRGYLRTPRHLALRAACPASMIDSVAKAKRYKMRLHKDGDMSEESRAKAPGMQRRYPLSPLQVGTLATATKVPTVYTLANEKIKNVSIMTKCGSENHAGGGCTLFIKRIFD